MTNISIYDSDYQKLEQLMMAIGEDSVAELFADMLYDFTKNNPDLFLPKKTCIAKSQLTPFTESSANVSEAIKAYLKNKYKTPVKDFAAFETEQGYELDHIDWMKY